MDQKLQMISDLVLVDEFFINEDFETYSIHFKRNRVRGDIRDFEFKRIINYEILNEFYK